VIYTTWGIPVWSVFSRMIGNSASTIVAGYSLGVGQRLVAPDGVHFASMQSDGNFVVYRGSTALWSTRTFGPNHRVVLQTDGNLVVYSATGRALWSSRSAGTGGSRLTMQTDGNLVVYRAAYPATWSWRTGPIALGPIGDDYPYRSAPAGQLDPWGFRVRSAESFVAWRLNNVNKVPFRSTTGGRTWGAPNTWDDTAAELGYRIIGPSARGYVAQTDAGPRGHVAWVADQFADGTVVVEEYDQTGTGTYSVRRVNVIAFRFIRIPSG
jgi:surface antigen